MIEEIADSGCLEDCEKHWIPFEKCYKYCQNHSEFKIPEDPKKLNEMAMELDIHPVCILCTYTCKQPYSWWSFQMPPQEYCSRFEERRLKDV